MKKRSSSQDSVNKDGWLTTYADLMNNLLVLFIALYAMSVLDLDKYQQFINGFAQNFDGKVISTSAPGPVDLGAISGVSQSEDSTAANATPPPSSLPPDALPGPDSFDELYEKVKTILGKRGYEGQLSVEKAEGFIYFRFTEGVFFYPDRPVMKESSYPIMQTVGEILSESNDLIEIIEISGHTAKITEAPQPTDNFFSWELSSDRALTVLKFLVQKCGLPQAKMSITGFSCNRPFATGQAEEFWAQNRRVEIRISRKTDFETP